MLDPSAIAAESEVNIFLVEDSILHLLLRSINKDKGEFERAWNDVYEAQDLGQQFETELIRDLLKSSEKVNY